MNQVIISVIVPVHNGRKYIDRLYKNISKQTFKNIEIIFVENFSIDNSLECLNNLALKDSRIIVLESKNRGTSLARKMGVEKSTGKYIVFMDQDDKYINQYALEGMYKTINETEASICQFNSYGTYGFGINSKSNIIDCRKIFSAQEIREKLIADIYAQDGAGVINAAVWTKIYRAEILRDAVKNVNFPLYYAEDQFLVICCLLSGKLENVCVDPQAFYIWNKSTGFSGSKDSGRELINDYEKVKPLIHEMLLEAKAGEEVFYRLHLESLYFMRGYLISQFDDKNLSHTYDEIEGINSLSFIKLAKRYVNELMDEKRRFEELMFLASNFQAEEFYNRYKSLGGQVRIKNIVLKTLRLFGN